MRIEHGDCLDVMRRLIDEGVTVDSCVTDPPYHLTGINKRYGSAHSMQTEHPVYKRHARGFMGQGWDGGDVAFRPETWALVYDLLRPGAHLVAFSGTRTYHRMVCAIEDAGFEIRDQLAWTFGSGFPKSHNLAGEWQGWGTALKPAWEPICLARKPLQGTVAANVLAHGAGALNIDGCRVEGDVPATGQGTSDRIYGGGKGLRPAEMGVQQFNPHPAGRWPANLIHDGSDEVLAGFPDAPGQAAAVTGNEPTANGFSGPVSFSGMKARVGGYEPRGDTGSAARFFYCAKAGADDRFDSKHPTVKPVALMRWLCRLVTPPGGTVLDPFAGTGTTGVAALREGFDPILIEREAEYHADILRRMAALHGTDTPLFSGEVA